MSFLKAELINHIYPDGVKAIESVTLTIQEGAFVALVGPSGTGKSTLLRVLGGLILPTSGTVQLDGESPSSSVDPIGIVFQRDNLMPWRTVRDNIRLPLELMNVDPVEIEHRVSELIELVGLLNFEHSYPSQLSGGMAQRVALARGLIHQPSLLLLDEPFGYLDALTRERMGRELLRIWQALPVTVFMVTHSIPEAVLMADKVLVMAGQPGTLTAEFEIGLPRPRQLEFLSRTDFQNYCSDVRGAIMAGRGG